MPGKGYMVFAHLCLMMLIGVEQFCSQFCSHLFSNFVLDIRVVYLAVKNHKIWGRLSWFALKQGKALSFLQHFPSDCL